MSANQTSAFQNIETLYFVWNADWSIKGALQAATDFVRGVESCALCDIAYDGARKKTAWKECHASIPVPIETVYRNKLDDRLAVVAGDEFPVVLATIGGNPFKLLDKSEIESCNASVDAFKALLIEKAAAHRLDS